MKLAVTILADNNSPFVEVFREVAEVMHASLVDLGHDCILVKGVPPTDRKSIVLAANLIHLRPLIPPDAIIYNMEQVGSYWFTPELVALYNSHTVWEYSATNAARYPSVGLRPPIVVPFGYHPCLTRIERKPEAERDIDVLFVGSMNDRRAYILNAIEARGLRVERVFAVFGPARDAYLARAKVLVNIHYYELAIFEQARCHYAVANYVYALSEDSANGEGRELVECVDYEQLVGAVCTRVHEPSRRDAAGYVLHDRFRTKPMTTALEAALRL